MRKINKIILHCSATREGKDFRASDIRRWHLERGFSDIGYHFIVDLDGKIEPGRPIEQIGAHCSGQNKDSIGICYIGGLDADNNPKDTRTEFQKESLKSLISGIRTDFGNIRVYGHNHFTNKACPCISEDEINEEYNNSILGD